MRTKQAFCAGCAMLLTVAWICGPVLGDEGARASAFAEVSMSISTNGTYSVTDYGAGIDLAYGDDFADDYSDGASNSSTYLEFDRIIYDYDLMAHSEGTGIAGQTHAGNPYVKAKGRADVWNVWHWAWAQSFAAGDIGVWIPDSNQTVCVTVTYKYWLSLVDAQPGGDPMPYDLPNVDMRMMVSFFGNAEGELLTEKGQWVVGGGGVEICRHSETVGYSETSPNYSGYDTTTWWVSVQAGQTYSLMSHAEVDARTPYIPEPATLSLLAMGGLTLLRRRRK